MAVLIKSSSISACRQLKKAGYTVDPAFNGLEGLTKMRANKYKYDCVLMDLEMPSTLLAFAVSAVCVLTDWFLDQSWTDSRLLSNLERKRRN
jgi:CheY-like chemotaxis protein